MHIQYVSPQVWAEFERKHTAAAAFIREENLRGELAALQRMPNPNRWQRDRMEELKTLFRERGNPSCIN
jgi:hypothetical protein